FISLEQYRAMAPRLPQRSKVAVLVEPTVDALKAVRDAGFNYFQVHFRPETTDLQLGSWARTVGENNLWLAPQLPFGQDVSPATLLLAKFILLDTFHQEAFGGTGLPGDWPKFARHQAEHPRNFWI